MKLSLQETKQHLSECFSKEERLHIWLAIKTQADELGKIAKKEQQRLGEVSDDVEQALYTLTGTADGRDDIGPAVIHAFREMSAQEAADLDTRQMDLEDEMRRDGRGLMPLRLPAGSANGDDTVDADYVIVDESGPVDLVDAEDLAECIVCGCDDNHACSYEQDGALRPCGWAELDRRLGYGLCDNPSCGEHDEQWRAFLNLLETPATSHLFPVHMNWARDRTLRCALRVLDDEAAETAITTELERRESADDNVVDDHCEICGEYERECACIDEPDDEPAASNRVEKQEAADDDGADAWDQGPDAWRRDPASEPNDPSPDLYERVLAAPCPMCQRHGVGAGDICVTVGGNPRNGFHANRIRAAIRAGTLRKDEYDAAYALDTNPEAASA